MVDRGCAQFWSRNIDLVGLLIWFFFLEGSHGIRDHRNESVSCRVWRSGKRWQAGDVKVL